MAATGVAFGPDLRDDSGVVRDGRAIRASDEERERCAESLRGHFTAGRLEAWELEERVERAWAARTRGELAALLHDLPREMPTRAPAWVRALDRVDRTLLRAHAVAFGATNGSFVAIWAVAGQGTFWPAWLLVPWAPFMAWHAGSSWTVRRLLRGRRAPRGLIRPRHG
jgi:hypothetical protein